MSPAVRIAAALFATAVGFRIKHKHSSRGQYPTEPAQVEGLYTFGSPSSTSPGLRNARREDGCFPGIRFVCTKHWTLLPTQMDIVPVLPRLVPQVVDLRHPMMDLWELDMKGDNKRTVTHNCSVATTEEPDYWPAIELHAGYPFHHAMEDKDPTGFLADVAHIGIFVQYFHTEWLAKQETERRGWRLVHSAFHDGEGDVGGGAQVTHLVQHPETLECMMTFQASKSMDDIQTDFNFIPEPGFCGLPNLVHRGFRDHMRNIIRTDDWQTNTRPKLPSCAKVWVVGTSLGGAVAELFTACNQFAPKPEDDPEGDYAYIGWTQGPARQLPYL